MNPQEVGETIKYLRIKEGLSQQNIADYLGISFQAVSKWERGLCLPDASYMAKLAEHLNVELEDLLEGNIKYLSDEWVGVLMLDGSMAVKDRDALLLNEEKPFLDILVSYFALAGIKKISIIGKSLTRITSYLGNGSQFGLDITYNMPVLHRNTMLVYGNLFAYGTNLTRYFWNGMARGCGVTILATDNETDTLKISTDKQRLIKKDKLSNTHILPIMFCQSRFMEAFKVPIEQWLHELIDNECLYAELTPRGLTTKLIKNYSDGVLVRDYISATEKMIGRKVYCLDDICKLRHIRT